MAEFDEVEAAVAGLGRTHACERPDLGEPAPDGTPRPHTSGNRINVANRAQLK